MSHRSLSRPKDSEYSDSDQAQNLDSDYADCKIPPTAVEFFRAASFLMAGYASPLNPRFLVQFKNPESFNKKLHWMIRDGAIPLIHFFRKHPKPGSIKSKLLIEQSLLGLVPKDWRSQVNSFRIVSKGSDSKTSKVLIHWAILCDEFGEGLFLDKLKKTSLRQFESKPIYAFLPFRKIAGTFSDALHHRCFSALTQRLGNDMVSLEWNQVLFRANFFEFRAVSFLDQYWTADPFIDQIILGRGGRMTFEAPRNQSKFVPLSPFHGVSIGTWRSNFSGQDLNTQTLERDADLAQAPWFFEWLNSFGREQPLPEINHAIC